MVDLRMRHKSMCFELVFFLILTIILLAADIGFPFPFLSVCMFFCSFLLCSIKKTQNAETRILWRLFGHKSLSMHTKTEITSTEQPHEIFRDPNKSSENSITNERNRNDRWPHSMCILFIVLGSHGISIVLYRGAPNKHYYNNANSTRLRWFAEMNNDRIDQNKKQKSNNQLKGFNNFLAYS